MDITDIYASDICLVEHSYGYGENSTEYILSDTQVVSLEGRLEEGDFDTDKDEVSDREELGTLEEVNISRLLEAYIKYNELDQEEADKLRADPIVKMYNYVSNPVLPDSDFDGRDDARDRARALDNSYKMTMDTDVVEDAKYDLNVDYRYFFMDNTKYYPELSDMAVTLANMVTRKGWQNKNWNNNTEDLSGSDIQSFMYHYGNEDIEVHDMSNYYSDANVCRYAIGQHDVFLRKGRVNNKVRNVITVAIGEIPEKTAELTANLYGLLGSDEDYKEYHHIGYDITASRIFENVLRFTENYNNNQKVFFITGARSAGGVANLLSKKLIDKFGQSSVYGYTFNAVATINGNMIPEGQKLPNLKYASIMNIYNDDEMMVMFTSEETNMYKYGTNVHMSLSENLTKKVNAAFRKVHRSDYDKNMNSKVVDLLNNIFNINLRGYSLMVYGMTGTEWREWDSYTSDEIEDYSARDIHNALSDDEVEILFNFWSEFYENTRTNSAYVAMALHAESQKNKIEKIRNIRKELSKTTTEINTNYVGQTNALNEIQVSGETPPTIPPSSNKNSAKSYDNILACVEQLAKLYINHVGTYRTILQTTSNSESNHSCTNRAYEYLKNNGVTIDEYKDNKKGYKVVAPSSNSSNIYAADGWLHYVYDENSDENTSPLISNWHVRDDCSGFVKSVIKLAGKEFTGFNTDLINGYDKSLAPNLSRAGYDLYQYANGVWSKISFSSLEFSSIKTELALPVGDSMDIDFLKPGDILVTNSHAEIYVGNNYNKVLGSITNKNDRNIAKKSHIWTNADVTHTDAMPVKIAKGTDVVGLPTYVREGTFAWGSVIDEFPTETKDGNRHYFYYDSGANCFRHCECGQNPVTGAHDNCNFRNREYVVVWRKR